MNDPAQTVTHRSQYGREDITVSALCPTVAIAFQLGRTHVGTTDRSVRAMIRRAIAEARLNDPRWDSAPGLDDEAVRFALWRHHENLAEYQAVMGSTPSAAPSPG